MNNYLCVYIVVISMICVISVLFVISVIGVMCVIRVFVYIYTHIIHELTKERMTLCLVQTCVHK